MATVPIPSTPTAALTDVLLVLDVILTIPPFGNVYGLVSE